MNNNLQNRDFIEIINQSLKDLGAVDLSMDRFKMVSEAMNQSYRFYHNDYHLKEMTIIPDHHIEELEKLKIKDFTKFLAYIRLAGFFHDIIYIQVDGSVDKNFQSILEENIEHNGNEWKVTEIKGDEILKVCVDIFNIKVGKVIPMEKVNEFLSAVVAARILKDTQLNKETITKIIICIEATVPFRTQEKFTARKKTIKKHLQSKMIDEVMYASVYLANKDCYNFSGYEVHSVDERLMSFLQNSWRLTLESEQNIKDQPIYADYFLSMLKRNLTFFNYMIEDDKYINIFHHHKDYPTRFRQKYFEERTRELLSYAVISHSIKLIAAGFYGAFEAFDQEIKYPLKLLNELSYIHIKKHKEEFFVFNPENSRNTIRDRAIIDSLTSGENFPSAIFDGGKSPIGKFLYKALSEDKIMELAISLLKNSFFIEKDKSVRKSKAMDYIYKVAYSVDIEVFDVILNTLQEVFKHLNNKERVDMTKKFKTLS